MVPVLALRRRRNRPRPRRPGEDEVEVEVEAVVAVEEELLATRRAKPLLTEPVKELGRMARTLSLRLIRKNVNEACSHETVSDS